jgi:hypothetical protein
MQIRRIIITTGAALALMAGGTAAGAALKIFNGGGY